MRWTALALAVIAIAAVALAPQAFWENDLSRLTPVPRDLLLTDQQLRAELGTADVRYLLVVGAQDSEEALRKLEALEPSLQELVSSGVIGGFDHAARYVPSAQTQQRRQQRLPDTAALREAVQRAQAGTPFRPDVFEPFVQDVEQARALQPLTVEALRASPLGASVDMLLTQRSGGVTALVTLSGGEQRRGAARVRTEVRRQRAAAGHQGCIRRHWSRHSARACCGLSPRLQCCSSRSSRSRCAVARACIACSRRWRSPRCSCSRSCARAACRSICST